MNVAFRDLKVGAQVQIHRAKSLAEGKSPAGAAVKLLRVEAGKNGNPTSYVFEAIKGFRFGEARVEAGQECIFRSPGLADQMVAVLEGKEGSPQLRLEKSGPGGLSLTDRNAKLVEKMLRDPSSTAKNRPEKSIAGEIEKDDNTYGGMGQLLQETMKKRELPPPTQDEKETEALVERLRMGMIAEAQQSLPRG